KPGAGSGPPLSRGATLTSRENPNSAGLLDYCCGYLSNLPFPAVQSGCGASCVGEILPRQSIAPSELLYFLPLPPSCLFARCFCRYGTLFLRASLSRSTTMKGGMFTMPNG